MDKKEIRKKCFALRESLKDEEKDRRIAQKILAHNKITDADTVLIYSSFRSEADTKMITEGLWEKGIKTAFPVCGENGTMLFHLVSGNDMFRCGKYGIMEPDDSLPCPEITEKTVCIVPGLAFTEKGGRLGYGGGYYDRFFEKYPNIYKIALSYDKLIMTELPLDSHDAVMDEIVTEERTVLCRE